VLDPQLDQAGAADQLHAGLRGPCCQGQVGGSALGYGFAGERADQKLLFKEWACSAEFMPWRLNDRPPLG
jgi:hypothetical protein